MITEAWVRVRPRPASKSPAGSSSATSRAAAAAVREIAQSGPASGELSPARAAEAELTGAGSGQASLLILGFEAADRPVDAEMEVALEIARSHGGTPRPADGPKSHSGSTNRPGEEGGDAVGAWRGAFLLAPYLRDTFVACGVLSETFETAITWDRFEEFHAEGDGDGAAALLRR